MNVRRLLADEAAVRRYAAELWIPYNRDLEATVNAHALASDADLVAEQVAFTLEKLESTEYRIEIAVDSPAEADDVESASGKGDCLGFIATTLDEAPSVFDRLDRLVVCGIYVREPHGTGLARDLIGCAVERARAEGCAELALDVDVDNERALGFYRKLGFEPLRHRMRVDTGRLADAERTRPSYSDT